VKDMPGPHRIAHAVFSGGRSGWKPLPPRLVCGVGAPRLWRAEIGGQFFVPIPPKLRANP